MLFPSAYGVMGMHRRAHGASGNFALEWGEGCRVSRSRRWRSDSPHVCVVSRSPPVRVSQEKKGAGGGWRRWVRLAGASGPHGRRDTPKTARAVVPPTAEPTTQRRIIGFTASEAAQDTPLIIGPPTAEPPRFFSEAHQGNIPTGTPCGQSLCLSTAELQGRLRRLRRPCFSALRSCAA